LKRIANKLRLSLTTSSAVKAANESRHHGYDPSDESKVPPADVEVDHRRKRPPRDPARQPDEDARLPSQDFPGEGGARAQVAGRATGRDDDQPGGEPSPRGGSPQKEGATTGQPDRAQRDEHRPVGGRRQRRPDDEETDRSCHESSRTGTGTGTGSHRGVGVGSFAGGQPGRGRLGEGEESSFDREAIQQAAVPPGNPSRRVAVDSPFREL